MNNNIIEICAIFPDTGQRVVLNNTLTEGDDTICIHFPHTVILESVSVSILGVTMPFQFFDDEPELGRMGKRASINKSTMGRDWVDVYTPWVQGTTQKFANDVKKSIEPSHRKWDKEKGCWHIHMMYLEDIVEILKRYFEDVTSNLLDEETAMPDNVFEILFEDLKNNPELLKKTYRNLQNALHPDHAGSAELSSKLNQAYEKFRDI